MERQTGRKFQAQPPPIPTELRYLWSTFLSLSRARGNNGFGPNPLSFTEIEAWCRLMHIRLDPWEVDTLRAIDDAFLEVAAEQN